MAISTQLIGRLGGGVETRTVNVSASTAAVTVGIPAGWRKAVGIFTGATYKSNTVATVFGDPIATFSFSPNVNGGGVLTAGETTSFNSLSGTLTWYRLE